MKKESKMLVLSRDCGESIMIGKNIKVTITGIDRGKVCIAIEAPREVPIFRSELLEKGDDNADSH